MDRGAYSVHRVVTSQIQLSSMQAVSNLVRKGKKKAKPSFFKLSIPCPRELILQNPGGRGETSERWRRTCFMAETQPEVGLGKPAEGEREGGREEEAQGAGDRRGCPSRPGAASALCSPGPQTCPLPSGRASPPCDGPRVPAPLPVPGGRGCPSLCPQA